MSAIKFGIVGAGWRAEFYLRIARALPNRFHVAGVLVRDPAKRAAFEEVWRVKAFPTLDDMLEKTSPAFVVTSVSWKSNPVLLKELAQRAVPVLSETPPGPDLEGLISVNQLTDSGARIQVAEQYWLQPHHATQLTLISKGLLGRPTQAQISAGHGYHGVSLIRRFLGISYETPKVTAKRFTSPVVIAPGKDGPQNDELIKESVQDFFWLDFGDRLGLLDFTDDQYFSWIRRERVLVRGERGEIINSRVYYLKDCRTPIELSFIRRTAGVNGNLEGNYLQGIQVGDEWAYHNPCAPASLADDEVAIATCLFKMAEYVRTGKEFYPLAEASQDHYLYLLCQQALHEGCTVLAEPQPWVR